MIESYLLAGVFLLANLTRAAADEVDPRVREYVDPVRTVWTGEAPKDTVLKPAVYDFGRELHGGVKLRLGRKVPKNGVKVRVRFGESVAEAMSDVGGKKNATNNHAIRDTVIDAPWYGTVEIGNTGFRFVRVDPVSTGSYDIAEIRAVSLERKLRQIGDFRCSDERLTRIFATAVRTAQLCCQEQLWDGIKRDRLVWQGDMHPEMMTILAVYGGDRVLTESLDWMIDNTAADGWCNGMPSYTLWFVRCLRDYAFQTGDAAYVRRHAAYVKEVLRHVVSTVDEKGDWSFGPNWGEYAGFLDWPTQSSPDAVRGGMRALYAMALKDGAELADGVLTDPKLAADCRAARRRVLSKPGNPHGRKAPAALLALAGCESPRKMFDEHLGKGGLKDVSTFYGYYMLEAMSLAGENAQALSTVRDYWGAMLDMGATSFWEDFDVAWTNNAFRIDELPVVGKSDVHGDNGNYCYAGFRHSLCHGWASGPAPWLLNHVLGLRIVGQGGTEVAFEPFLGDLKWAEGALATPKGPVCVRVERGTDGKPVGKVLSKPDGVTVVGGRR